MTSNLYLDALILGFGATAFMDLAALAQKRFLGLPSLDYAMVGRWLGHIPRGKIIHRPIAASEPIFAERLTGWIVHYAIGIIFGVIFLLLVGQDWLANPSLLPALAFGGATVLAPFLILQPCLGAGLAARRTPHPSIARCKSISTHLIFGLGLWLTGLCVTWTTAFAM